MTRTALLSAALLLALAAGARAEPGAAAGLLARLDRDGDDRLSPGEIVRLRAAIAARARP
jgi:hypothetical protein